MLLVNTSINYRTQLFNDCSGYSQNFHCEVSLKDNLMHCLTSLNSTGDRASGLGCSKLAWKANEMLHFKLAWTKSRRANALPLASALASASTFTLKFFKSLYFLNHLMDSVHIWHNDRYRSKVYISNIVPWPIDHKGQ